MNIAAATCILIASASVLHLVGVRFAARYPASSRPLLAFCVLLAVVHSWFVGGQLWWATFLPPSVALVLSHIAVVLLGFCSGLIVGSHSVDPIRAQCIAAALWVTGVASVTNVMMRPVWNPIRLSQTSTWRNGVCLQSHHASCSAAAAATLLSHHAIDVSESEMAEASFTSGEGTMAIGTFHGLYKYTNSRVVRPVAVSYSRDELPTRNQLQRQLPMLINVSMDKLPVPGG